jgi:hypothetical protein
VTADKIKIDREKNLEVGCHWCCRYLFVSEQLAQSEPGKEMVVGFVARSGCD